MLPWPGWLSTHSLPAINPTSLEEIERPRPVPPYFRVIELSDWAKASKITCCFAGGIPGPVSTTLKCRTDRHAVFDSTSTFTTTSPAEVNLTAFPTRLITT